MHKYNNDISPCNFQCLDLNSEFYWCEKYIYIYIIDIEVCTPVEHPGATKIHKYKKLQHARSSSIQTTQQCKTYSQRNINPLPNLCLYNCPIHTSTQQRAKLSSLLQQISSTLALGMKAFIIIHVKCFITTSPTKKILKSIRKHWTLIRSHTQSNMF